MLRALGENWALSIPDDIPDELITEHVIGSEPEILRRYLATVKRSGSAELERGFLCVLSDFIGCSRDNQVDLERYTHG
jgi:hypothetical protein